MKEERDKAETHAAQLMQDIINLREENARLQEQLRQAVSVADQGMNKSQLKV